MLRTTPLDQDRVMASWRGLVLAVLEAVAPMRLEEMRQVRQPWALHSWRLRLCDVATRWQLLEDVAPAPGRVGLRHGSSSGRGSSCERTMARRRWDAGSSQIAIAAECGVRAVE